MQLSLYCVHEDRLISNLITLTNHFPFQIDDEDKLIDEYDSESDILNRYVTTVRYEDEALKHFIAKLKKNGLYDNSVIVFMGDHYGISEAHNDALAQFLGKDEITPYDTVQLQRVPLIIHIPGVTDQDPKTISETGGQRIKGISTTIQGSTAETKLQFELHIFPDSQTAACIKSFGSILSCSIKSPFHRVLRHGSPERAVRDVDKGIAETPKHV